jgi:hypothetical protein
MNMMSRKIMSILSLFLIASFTFTFFIMSITACSDNSEDNAADDAANAVVSEDTVDDDENENAAVTERLYPNVPEMDLDGYEFNILTFALAGNVVFDYPDITAETETGEMLNDAVYKRNLAVEERFNIKIKQIHSVTSPEDLAKAVAAGEDTYDLVGQRMVTSLNPVVSGYYLDLHSLPNLDLTKPWYIQDSVKNLTFNGKLFTVMTEMLISQYSATSIIVFNKELHSNMALSDPYQMVKDGKWTLDALYELSKDGSRDLNGDGISTYEDDQWGFVTGHDALDAFLIGGGGEMGRIVDGSLVITFENEKNYNILDKAFNLLYDSQITVNVQMNNNHGAITPNEAMRRIWQDGRGLFGWTRLANVRTWREIDLPFGILPVPKFDEAQEHYYSLVNTHQAMSIGIPVTASNIDRTTAIFEAMSCESHYILQPAYFETQLKMKQARDEESAEMIEYIFKNISIDPIIMYNFGNMLGDFQMLVPAQNTNIQSFYERIAPAAERDIQRLNEFIENLN